MGVPLRFLRPRALVAQRMGRRLLNGNRAGSNPAEGSFARDCSHRPTAQVAGLSIRKCGFDSRWERRCLANAWGLLVENMHPHRGVAQPGKSACLGDRRSPVRIRPPRPRSRTAEPVQRLSSNGRMTVFHTVRAGSIPVECNIIWPPTSLDLNLSSRLRWSARYFTPLP